MNTTANTAEPIIATTDGKRVYLSNGVTLPMRGGAAPTLPALCQACELYSITQLWVWYWPSDLGAAGNDVWDVQENEQRSWMHAFRKGTNTEIEIVHPNRDPNGPWADANSAEDLLDGLILYRTHVGIPFHRTGGTTSFRLLRQLHTGKGAIPMKVTEMPAPALAGGTETALAWMNPRAASMVRGMEWIHSYDKNGAYLGAASGDFPVGYGAFTRLRPGNIAPDLYTLPGYWLVSIDEGSRIPSFNHGKTGQQWVTTPTLAYAVERGATVQVHDAYVWPRHHRPLEPWQKRLAAARTALGQLAEGSEPGAPLALAAVKATYGESVGYFAGKMANGSTWDRTGDPFYRPDIRHMLIARARVNIMRRVDKMVADGVMPLAICGTDTVLIASNEPDPRKAAPSALPLGDKLNEWKANPPIPVRDVYGVLSGDLPSAKQLQALVKRVQGAKGTLA